MDQHPAGEKLLCERGEACFGDLFVFLGCGKTRADASDHFAVDYDREPALHLDEASSGYRCVTTVVDRLLQRLGGFLEERRAARFACCQLDRSGHRGMIHAFEQNDPTAFVDDRDDTASVIALRLGLGRCDHLPCRFQAQRLLLQELRLRARPQKNDRREGKATGNSVPHRNLLFEIRKATAPPLARPRHRCRRTPR